MLGGQPRQKVSETPISTNKAGVVVLPCHPNYTTGTGTRFASEASLEQKAKTQEPIWKNN
jgi:hypothetical protein